MLYHYSGTIDSNMSSSITYNNKSSLLLNGNLSMSYAEMKEIIFHGLEWNYNDVDVEITWRCQIGEY
jgi:hypothetical protein